MCHLARGPERRGDSSCDRQRIGQVGGIVDPRQVSSGLDRMVRS